MIAVYQSRSFAKAHLVQQMLVAHGIPAVVVNEHLTQAAGDLPLDVTSYPTVCVADEVAAAEAHVLLHAQQLEAEGPDWTCDRCHESNGAAFAFCWKCGAE